MKTVSSLVVGRVKHGGAYEQPEPGFDDPVSRFPPVFRDCLRGENPVVPPIYVELCGTADCLPRELPGAHRVEVWRPNQRHVVSSLELRRRTFNESDTESDARTGTHLQGPDADCSTRLTKVATDRSSQSCTEIILISEVFVVLELPFREYDFAPIEYLLTTACCLPQCACALRFALSSLRCRPVHATRRLHSRACLVCRT